MTIVQPSRTAQIMLWLKLAYTAFLAVLIPYYWVQYTPVNFLWFCDVALIVTMCALWLESKFLASMQAVAITIPQFLWAIDFVVHLVFGVSTIGMSDYMFDLAIPLYVRGLSFFHFWLPFLLLWVVWRLGYDRRAWIYQIGMGWAVLLASYFFTNGPGGPAGNVNKVWGPGGDNDPPQTWMSPFLWLVLLMVAYPLCIYLPTHLIFRKTFRR